MKAVNQSIGRAVRHKDDYASVILLDQRYLQENRQAGLPAWIKRSLESHEKFGSAFASLRKVQLKIFLDLLWKLFDSCLVIKKFFRFSMERSLGQSSVNTVQMRRESREVHVLM